MVIPVSVTIKGSVMSDDIDEHVFKMESFKASIEELNLMHEIIQEYLMELRLQGGVTEVKDNVVPLFHKPHDDEPEDIA